MFGSRLGFLGLAHRIALFAVRWNPRWRLTAILDIQKWPQLRNCCANRRHVCFWGQVFGVGRSNGATFNDLEWPQTPVSRSQYSLKANVSQMVHPIHSMSGYIQGFSGSVVRMHAICGLIISKMAADGHLGMMALSRVTLASAGLSCITAQCTLVQMRGLAIACRPSVRPSVCL